jgi:hypothetical protein
VTITGDHASVKSAPHVGGSLPIQPHGGITITTADESYSGASRVHLARRFVVAMAADRRGPRRTLVLLICAMFSQGYDIGRHVGELVVGKMWVRHAPFARHSGQGGNRATQRRRSDVWPVSDFPKVRRPLQKRWKWLISRDDVTTGASLLSQITAGIRITAIGRFLRICGIRSDCEKRNGRYARDAATSSPGIVRQALAAELLTERIRVLWLCEAEHYEVEVVPSHRQCPQRHRKGLRKRVHNVVVFMAPYLVGR